jgi:pyruvate,water dikinase
MSTNPPPKYTYFFGAGQAEGGSAVQHLVGGKGASLADMTRAGLNVPPGFTISAECCDLFYRANRQWPAGLEEQVRESLTRLEQLAGRSFGRGDEPLLLAVRSGAAQSMPGMMDTVLNVGLHPDCVRRMAERTGNPRGAWEAYRHFLMMFGHTVGGVPEAVFAELIAGMLRETGKSSERELDAAEMQELCGRISAAYHRHAGRELPVEPWAMLVEAINAVFGSWNSERAVAYRAHHGIDGLLGTAVNVQMMCPAEVAGVLFTANPVNPALQQILVESSFGLGEAVVLGKVTPDRFVLDRRSLRVVERQISAKEHVVATLSRAGRAPAAPRDTASLTDAQLEELARLGLRVEEYFRRPCDIEWALAGGQFYLLQSRPIKGLAGEAHPAAEERERVRQEEIAALAARAEPGGTVWSRYNLAEVLPEPTPMTWAIVRRFMAGRGGFGLMYRDLGFDPDPALDDEGVFDLVCGRPYCNLSREPRLHFHRLPFEHSFAKLKAAPHRALYPCPEINPARAGWRFWLFLPVQLPLIIVQLVRAELRQRRLSQTLAARLREQLLPAFAAETRWGAEEDLSKLDDQALQDRLQHWIQRTLHDFARDSLKPTALAGLAMGKLEQALQRSLGAERTRAALGELVMGVRPDPEADLPGAVRDLAAGALDRAAFLQRFGHRGSQEMELAQPRWAEEPALLDRLLGQGQAAPAVSAPADAWERIAAEAKLTDAQKSALAAERNHLLTYLALRETAKHYLMMGYALIRRCLVELDRRKRLEGGIFFLTPEELPRLTAGEDLSKLIAERRRRRELALGLEVPPVLFSDDLEAIGRPGTGSSADTLHGVPLSAGVAEGVALVLEEPGEIKPPGEAYILVCPSTDPAWVPLFVRAKGLIMETGGVLSHGAIVAREFGLPAVAGLPGVHRRLRTGQRLRLDGARGTVLLLPG